MKRIIAVVLSVLMLAALSPAVINGFAEGDAQMAPVIIKKIWDGTVADSFGGGDGSAENPFIISTGSQLAYLAECINTDKKFNKSCFKLECDIRLNDTSNRQNWDTDKPANIWKAIGSKPGKPENINDLFQGIFDGNGYTIYGIYINTTESFQGLFGTTMNATLKNITVTESYIKGNNVVGGVAGAAVGGLITDCRNEATIIGNEGIGGIVGALSKINVRNCHNNGKVSGNLTVGGVMGGLQFGSIAKNCYNTGSVSGNESVGGVVGYSSFEYPVLLTCYNTGSVSGAKNVGGIMGRNENTVLISNCYDIGSVIGATNVGSIVGLREGSSTIMDCYYLQGQAKDYSGKVKYGIGDEVTGYTIKNSVRTTTGLTEKEMKQEISYYRFDFDKNWMFSAIGDYKYPVLINNAPYLSMSNEELTSKIFTRLGAETKVENFANSRIKVFDAEKAPMENDTIIGTGCYFDFTDIHGITSKYTVCIRGDIDGDGKHGARDYLMLKRAVLNSFTLEGVFAKAGCVSGGSSLVAKDYIMLKRVVLDTYELK